MRAQQAQQRHDLLQQLQDLLNPHSDPSSGPVPTPPASSGCTTPSDAGSTGGNKESSKPGGQGDKTKPNRARGDKPEMKQPSQEKKADKAKSK